MPYLMGRVRIISQKVGLEPSLHPQVSFEGVAASLILYHFDPYPTVQLGNSSATLPQMLFAKDFFIFPPGYRGVDLDEVLEK